MKIKLLFCKRLKGIGTFRTKKAAYRYVKSNRKFFGEGFFVLEIYKDCSCYSEPVRAQDILINN